MELILECGVLPEAHGGAGPAPAGGDQGIVIIDALDRARAWQALFPGSVVRTPGPELFADGALPARAAVIVINADLRLPPAFPDLGAPPTHRRLSGVHLALRFRQQPQRYDCPILLLSVRDRPTRPNDPDLAMLLAAEWGHHWLTYPCPLAKLSGTIMTAVDQCAGDPTWGQKLRMLGREVCGRALRGETQRFRHTQGQFRAAVRLLLGGMEAGRVPIDKGKRVVEEICRRRGNQPSELDRFDFALAERYIALIDPGNHAVSTGVRRKLRVLDDQFKNAGWDLVLPALLEPDWTIDGFTTVKDFLCSCDDCSAFLIDYDLGVEQMTGLDVVAQLQQSDPFTPVVLFTAHDQAALFTTAVEWGVSHFLIKELSDTADRDSGDYYNHFHRLFEVLAKTDTAALAKVRYAWRSLGQLGSGAKNESAPQHGAMLEALWYLERVFFFTATAIHSAASNDIGIGLRAERVHATQRAAGIYSGRIVRELLQLYGLTDKLPESVVQDAGVEDWEIIALVTWARESRHGTSAAITESRIARFALCAARLVCACCRSWKLEFGPLPSRREGIAPPLIRGDSQRVESHRYRSVTGAVRFILGYHLSRPCNAITGDFAASLFSQAVNAAHAGASGDEMVRSALAEITIGTAPSLPAVAVPTTSVVLVDDCGNTDGWYEALRKGLEQTAVTVVEYRGRKDRKAVLNHVRRCGVALVDLRLPPAINHAAVEEEGFELLKFLREPESGTAHIPIIAFSANSDGLSARRSLAAGAQHYFTKTDSLLATALDCNNPDFFTKYRDSMLEMLRARGPGGELQMLRAMSAEVAKPERYQLMDGLPVAEGHARSLRLAQRARTVSEGFAAHLDAEINLACDLAWQERTPSAPAQWRIIRRPWPIDPQLANGSPADECSVILSSLVESLLTFAILVDAREQAAQMNPPLGRRFGHQDRIEFVKKHESAFRYASRRRGELYELNGLRNGVLHGDSSSRLARVLQLAAQLIPALLDEILHQVSLLRASGAQGQ